MKWTRRRLKPEIDKWIEAGDLEPAAAERILQRYPEAGTHWWLVAFAVIGSLLCLAGIILLMAHNWASIPDLMKWIGFLGLLVGATILGVESATRKWMTAWAECSFLVAAVMPLLGLLLLSQTFHLEGAASPIILAWLIFLIPLALWTPQISPWVVCLLAQMSLILSSVEDGWIGTGGTDSFETGCWLTLVWGLAMTGVAMLWRRMGQPDKGEVTEFWGFLTAGVAGYLIGFIVEGWVAWWILLFLACLTLIFSGFQRVKIHQINLAFVLIGLVILSTFLRLAGTMLDTGLLFLGGGLALLLGVWSLNRVRHQVVSRINARPQAN